MLASSRIFSTIINISLCINKSNCIVAYFTVNATFGAFVSAGTAGSLEYPAGMRPARNNIILPVFATSLGRFGSAMLLVFGGLFGESFSRGVASPNCFFGHLFVRLGAFSRFDADGLLNCSFNYPLPEPF